MYNKTNLTNKIKVDLIQIILEQQKKILEFEKKVSSNIYDTTSEKTIVFDPIPKMTAESSQNEIKDPIDGTVTGSNDEKKIEYIIKEKSMIKDIIRKYGEGIRLQVSPNKTGKAIPAGLSLEDATELILKQI